MPDWKRYVRDRLALPTRPEREAEVIEEIAQQLEAAYDSALKRGATPQEAALAAQREVDDWSRFAGDIEPSLCRPDPIPAIGATSRAPLLDQLAQDLRFAARMLASSPGFALFAAGITAAGIGISTAVFSLAWTVALRPLPYPEPHRLVAIDTVNSGIADAEPFTSAPDIADLAKSSRTVESMAGVSPVWNLNVRNNDGGEVLESLFVSAALMPMLGVQPAAGRVFRPEEDVWGKPALVAMLGYEYAQRRFGGASQAVGQTLVIEGSPGTVVGVLPPGFRYLGNRPDASFGTIDLVVPLAVNPLVQSRRSLRFLQVAGRLRPGVTPEQARAELAGLGRNLAQAYPATNKGFDVSAVPLTERAVGKVRKAMLLLLAAIGVVLLIACANLANALLARMTARGQEMSVRVALGASSSRIFRQIVTESALVAIIGGAAGWALAHVLLRALISLSPAALPRRGEISLDGAAVAFAIAAAFVAAVVPSIPAAIALLRRDAVSNLRGRGAASNRGASFRKILVVAEVSLGLVLFTAAGLLVRSFIAVLDVNPGYRVTGLATISTQLGAGGNTPPQERVAMLRRIEEQVRRVPGVVNVGAVSRLPLMNMTLSSWLNIEGRPAREDEKRDVEYRRANAGYFPAMGIALRQGRIWNDGDAQRQANLALVNETLARKYFPGQSPVGKRIRFGEPAATPNAPWTEIAGVVADIRHFNLDVEPTPEAYVPDYLVPFSAPILVIQTTGDPKPMLRDLAAAVRSAGSGISTYKAYSMEQLVSRATAGRRFVMSIVATFAGLALLLVSFGVYGVMAQSVGQRVQEIGVRMAVGAGRWEIVTMVLRDGGRLALAGALAGFVLSLLMARAMRSLLFSIRPLDPASFALGLAVLLAAATLACLIPAWRAARTDPITALRAG